MSKIVNFPIKTYECIGCEESFITIEKKHRIEKVGEPSSFKIICEKCNPKKDGYIPLDAPQYKKLALVKCRECGAIIAILEAGKTPDGRIIKERTTYDGVCGKCLKDEEKMIVNIPLTTEEEEKKNETK